MNKKIQRGYIYLFYIFILINALIPVVYFDVFFPELNALVSKIFVILSITLFIVLLNKSKKSFNKKFSFDVLILVMIVLLLAIANSYADQANYSYYIKYVIPYYILLLMTWQYKLFTELKFMPIMNVAINLYLITFTILVFVLGADIFFKESYGGIMRFQGIGSITLHSYIGAIGSIFAITYILKKKYIILNLVILMNSSYHLVIGASRTAMLIVVVFFFLLIINSLVKKEIKNFLIFSSSILVLLMGFLIYSSFINDNLYLRIVGENTKDYSSGRLDAWIEWINYNIHHNELFYVYGLGLGYTDSYLQEYRGNNNLWEWPHNEVIRKFVEEGVLLLLLYITLYLRIISKVLKKIDFDIIILLSIFIPILLFENLFNRLYLALIILIPLYSIYLKGEVSENNTSLPNKSI